MATFGYRLEAIKIVVVPKGSEAPGITVKPFVKNKNSNLNVNKRHSIQYKDISEKLKNEMERSGRQGVHKNNCWSTKSH
ncbi:MAP domain-containing protein [Acetobacterium bakii]|uniref:MAP domain-containing protein n=1 Tax=Acetobacterium bakii TaxID=52689 RepID=A0A0L6U259_9FIRM|nr:hypothetical protein AKG39_09590 [Acetobacterium bakii]